MIFFFFLNKLGYKSTQKSSFSNTAIKTSSNQITPITSRLGRHLVVRECAKLT